MKKDEDFFQSFIFSWVAVVKIMSIYFEFLDR